MTGALSPFQAARWRPSVTVAAIISQPDAHGQPRFLLIEEHTAEGLRLNNPAGHLDPSESPEQAVIREALEETTRVFSPSHLLGVYLSRFQRESTGEDITYLRLAYAGTVGEQVPGRSLDQGIVRTLWMTLQEVRDSAHRHRSPLVLSCIEDLVAGRRYPLQAVTTHPSVTQAWPVVRAPN
ncbi:MAG: NUDIX hydrolase [Betaproteobacteria bacterium]|nr:NUDIX hydrolase [Betaproteobacteria bacterium]